MVSGGVIQTKSNDETHIHHLTLIHVNGYPLVLGRVVMSSTVRRSDSTMSRDPYLPRDIMLGNEGDSDDDDEAASMIQEAAADLMNMDVDDSIGNNISTAGAAAPASAPVGVEQPHHGPREMKEQQGNAVGSSAAAGDHPTLSGSLNFDIAGDVGADLEVLVLTCTHV